MPLTWPQNRTRDLVSMGRVAVDLYAEQIGAPLKDAQTFRKYVGGCAGNIAIGSARLGLEVAMLSSVGHDDFGDFVRETLIKEGVDVAHLQKSSDHLTGLVVLGVCPPHHFPLLFYREQCADLFIDKNVIDPDLISSSKALLITGTAFSHEQSRDATFHALKIARQAGTKVIFDIDYRPVLWGITSKGNGELRFIAHDFVTEHMKSVLPLCDVIVGTEEEIAIASGERDVLHGVSAIKDNSHAVVVVKKGLHGAYLHDENHVVSADAYPVPVLNVLGAGDAFMSGLLSGLLQGLDYQDALRRANACGALVVSRHGCAPAMPSLDEVSYFQQVHQRHHNVVHDAHLAELHQKISKNNNNRKNPLAILAFCHRWQFEESCRNNHQPFSRIKTFKTLMAKGFIRACAQAQIDNKTILTDPDYGQEAIELLEDLSANIIVPIEESKLFPSAFINGYSCYETLLKHPQSWGVKYLWPYHEALDNGTKTLQKASLKELFHSCNELDRNLMLEVVAPPGYVLQDDDVIKCVAQVYDWGVKPYWWKLSAFSLDAAWQKLTALIDTHDADARVVVLGGEQKSLQAYQESFKRAQSSHHGIGFAVGRSIFWSSWEKYISGSMSCDDVEHEIAANFLFMYQQWRECHE